MRFITVILFILAAPLATAQSLTTERAEDFLQSLDGVQEFTDTLDEDVRTGALDSDIMPGTGASFEPYTRAVEHLREDYPDVHDDLANTVESYGFDSLDSWAQTGDRVAVAYIALQMEGTEMEEVSPEMLDQVPAQMRPQIERMLAIVDTVRNAPPEDVEALRPLSGMLEEVMGEIQR